MNCALGCRSAKTPRSRRLGRTFRRTIAIGQRKESKLGIYSQIKPRFNLKTFCGVCRTLSLPAHKPKRGPKYSDPSAKPWNRIMRPDQTEKWALRRTDTLVEGIRSTGVNVNEEGLSSWLLSSWKRVSTIAASFLRGREDTLPNEKTERPITDLKTPAFKPPGDHNRKKLRNMPFTLDTFRFVSKMMSIHSWIGRLISRANVPAFERTLTEMPLYTSTGGSMVRQKAISKWICSLLLKPYVNTP